MISLKQIEDWWERAEEATHGPWRTSTNVPHAVFIDTVDGPKHVTASGPASVGTPEDAAFIASARESVPKMANTLTKVYQSMLDELVNCRRGCGKKNPTCGTCTTLLTILDKYFDD